MDKRDLKLTPREETPIYQLTGMTGNEFAERMSEKLIIDDNGDIDVDATISANSRRTMIPLIEANPATEGIIQSLFEHGDIIKGQDGSVDLEATKYALPRMLYPIIHDANESGLIALKNDSVSLIAYTDKEFFEALAYDMPHVCELCKYFWVKNDPSSPCKDCDINYGRNTANGTCWEWRGPIKGVNFGVKI